MSAPAEHKSSTFASLTVRNYRLFASGQLVSNTGVWVQRIAQDWLVLTITGSATAVGITTALQFLPTLLFGLVGGMIADRYDKRRVLLATQTSMSLLAVVLAALTLSHTVREWHVFVVAFCLGLVVSVDNPVRQSFVNEMVGPDQLRNAISINSSVFQLGGLIGPAVSGVLITATGPGWSFAINAVSFLAPITALSLMRRSELTTPPRRARRAGQLAEAMRYVRDRPGVFWPVLLAGSFGLFTINLPVTLAAYANSVFQSGPGGYGLLSSIVACGSLTGALISARRMLTRLRSLVVTAAALCGFEIIASMAPTQWAYSLALVPVGAATLLFLTGANSIVQVASADSIRGRVMGIYLLVFIGSGALGGPLVGYIDQHYGPRTGMLLAGLVPLAVLCAVAAQVAHSAHLHLRVQTGHGVRLLLV